MKIGVNTNYVKLVENEAKAIQKYSALSAEKKREVQEMAFIKVFLYFWFSFGRKSAWIREKSVKLKKTDNETDINAVFDSETVSNVVTIKSRGMDEDKKPRATAKVSFAYDDLTGSLNVDIAEVECSNAFSKANYEHSLHRELMEAKKDMDIEMDFEIFLKYFFGTLKATELAYVEGGEAVLMYRIYNKAMERYPLFEKLNMYDRLDVLDRGLRRARAARSGARDIHYFAKCTFEVFAEDNLINKVIREDHVTGKLKTYYKVSENRRDRVNPDAPSQVWERNCLIFATYKDLNGIQTSFLAFDLWNMLAQSTKVNADDARFW